LHVLSVYNRYPFKIDTITRKGYSRTFTINRKILGVYNGRTTMGIAPPTCVIKLGIVFKLLYHNPKPVVPIRI
jgi:hypothetical protein